MSFYVYTYLDTRRPGPFKYGSYEFSHEPFYVGRGGGNRRWAHLASALRGERGFKADKIRKIILVTGTNPLIEVCDGDLTLDEATVLEVLLITTIGRYDLGRGPLCNHTNGGDGLSEVSEASRLKMSQSAKKKRLSDEHKEKIRLSGVGRKHSTETREKIGKGNRGKVLSDETKRLIGSYHRGKVISSETRVKLCLASKRFHDSRR